MLLCARQTSLAVRAPKVIDLGAAYKTRQALVEGFFSTFFLFLILWTVLSLKSSFALDTVFCQNAYLGAPCRGSNLWY